MSHKEIPCPKCRRIWLWADWKNPEEEEAECPVGTGCNTISEKSDTSIQDKLNEILRRLEQIEKSILDQPVVQYPSYPYPTTPFPPPYIPSNSCAKCGIALEGVMGYVCSDKNCPTFMKVTC